MFDHPSDVHLLTKISSGNFVEGDGAVVVSRENQTRACFGKKGVDLKHKNSKISVNLASI